MDDVNPHTCSRCLEITMDLTKLSRKQEYRYTFDRVATYAKDCAFFQWAHDIAITVLSSTRELRISFESDPGRLVLKWVSSSFLGDKSLYIFVREGIVLSPYLPLL